MVPGLALPGLASTGIVLGTLTLHLPTQHPSTVHHLRPSWDLQHSITYFATPAAPHGRSPSIPGRAHLPTTSLFRAKEKTIVRCWCRSRDRPYLSTWLLKNHQVSQRCPYEHSEGSHNTAHVFHCMSSQTGRSSKLKSRRLSFVLNCTRSDVALNEPDILPTMRPEVAVPVVWCGENNSAQSVGEWTLLLVRIKRPTARPSTTTEP